jgi:hypothetical protein
MDKNGTLKSTTDPLVDLFFASTRDCLDDTINSLLDACYEKEPQYIKAVILHTRGIRDLKGKKNGKGEKKLFVTMMKWLSKKDPEIFNDIINSGYIEKIGCWKDYIVLCDAFLDNENVCNDITDIIVNQLIDDYFLYLKNKPFTLCAKWVPSEGKKYKEVYKLLIDRLNQLRLFSCFKNINNKGIKGFYRKVVTDLRSQLDIVENKICAGKWDEIDFSKVPSLAFKKYNKSFNIHIPKHFNNYIKRVKSSTKEYSFLDFYSLVEEENDALEAQFHCFLDELREKNIPYFQVVADLSSSMFSVMGQKPAKVSIMLAIVSCFLFNEQVENEQIGYWYSFSTIPEKQRTVVYRNGQPLPLREIYNCMSKTNWETNINLQYAIDDDEPPKMLLIVSDMQFNNCTNITNWDMLKQKYGERLPRIVFWNVSCFSQDFSLQSNEEDVLLISGYSETFLNIVLRYNSPSQYVRTILDQFIEEEEEEEEEENRGSFLSRILNYFFNV